MAQSNQSPSSPAVESYSAYSDALYDATSERFWEKLETHREEIDLKGLSVHDPFLFDELTDQNPLVGRLVNEVEQQFDYGMSFYQCTWATKMFFQDEMTLEKYNEHHGTELKERP